MKAAPLLPMLKQSTRLLVVLLLAGMTPVALAAPYVPPSGLGAPARRESAGTRGCVFGNPASLIALMPESGVGRTTEAYPTFYWYLPISQASFVEFTLTHNSDTGEAAELIYQTRFAVTGEKGIMSLQLPPTASMPPLVEGDRYHWQVAVFCNPNSPSGELQVDGWIERQAPDASLTAALTDASELDQANLYASNGYWFDALDRLMSLQVSDPDNTDIQANLAEFLASAGLSGL